MVNLTETVNAIKAAGPLKVRIVPQTGEHYETGLYVIEILKESSWCPILSGVPRQTADNLVNQASCNLLCE